MWLIIAEKRVAMSHPLGAERKLLAAKAEVLASGSLP